MNISTFQMPDGIKPEDYNMYLKEIEQKNKKLEITNQDSSIEKYVLFLDILGFKDLVENNTVKEVEEIYKHQIIETIGPALEMAFQSYKIPYVAEQILDGHILKDTVHNEFNIYIMSDSIIIWTKDNSLSSFTKLCSFVTSFLAFTFLLGVPLRGAISKGHISKMQTVANAHVQSCIVGTGIVKAYQLEGIQKWMGCLVDKDCINDLPPETITRIHSKNITSIVNYNVPIKDGKTTNEYVINWANTRLSDVIKDDLDFFNERFSQFNKNIDIPSVKEKILNSLDFYQSLK